MNKIEIYPAIDLYDRKVVRLTGGDFEKIKEYGDDPVETALSFAEAGARWIHLIDLEGAEKGSPVHLKELEKVAASTGLPVQYGGGLRTEEDVALALSSGAKRV
ncbi:MAG: HisA/HisF-related TIM barrel protein, partial [Synergistota bacterium]|nr:HisA/HisF-related TIM barrel protein [Synergistota bacterium]